MSPLLDAWNAVRDFVESGGNVLPVIFIVTMIMWTLIIERYWYLVSAHRQSVEAVTGDWQARTERSSWHAHQIRRAAVSRISMDLKRTIPLIKTMVALCPLLGLLGTVTGMVEVFDVMSIAGSGNPRAMASGVAHATIPTMAGMVAALSGLIFGVQLERRAQRESDHIADQLSPEG